MKCMRPPDKWAKPSEPATFRRGPYKRRKGKNGEPEPQSDCLTDTQAEGQEKQDNQTQTSRATEKNKPYRKEVSTATRAEEELPVRKRPRASSVEPRAEPLEKKPQWTGPAAAAAFRRAIQSSPPRLLGTANTPIEIDSELTPKPTRRLLFSSPQRHGEIKALEDGKKDKSSTTASPLKSKTKLLLDNIKKSKIQNDDDAENGNNKENCPPADPQETKANDDVDEFADLFDDNIPGFQLTPNKNENVLFDPLCTPKSRCPTNQSNITAASGKRRTPLGSCDDNQSSRGTTANLSAGKRHHARRHSIELSTPSKSAKRKRDDESALAMEGNVEMTPLTASWYNIVANSYANGVDGNVGVAGSEHQPWTWSPTQAVNSLLANIAANGQDPNMADDQNLHANTTAGNANCSLLSGIDTDSVLPSDEDFLASTDLGMDFDMGLSMDMGFDMSAYTDMGMEMDMDIVGGLESVDEKNDNLGNNLGVDASSPHHHPGNWFPLYEDPVVEEDALTLNAANVSGRTDEHSGAKTGGGGGGEVPDGMVKDVGQGVGLENGSGSGSADVGKGDGNSAEGVKVKEEVVEDEGGNSGLEVNKGNDNGAIVEHSDV